MEIKPAKQKLRRYFTTQMPVELAARARLEAARRGCCVRDLVIEGLNLVVPADMAIVVNDEKKSAS